jgi:hypothetical protein
MINLGLVDKALHSNNSGAPFIAAVVDDAEDGDTKLVIMFEEEGHIAVLSLDKLIEEEDIATTTAHAKEIEEQLRSELWGEG